MFYATLTVAIMSTIFLFVALGVATWFYGEYRPLVAEVSNLEKDKSLLENENQMLQRNYGRYVQEENDWNLKIDRLKRDHDNLAEQNRKEQLRHNHLTDENRRFTEEMIQINKNVLDASVKEDELFTKLTALQKAVEREQEELDRLNEEPVRLKERLSIELLGKLKEQVEVILEVLPDSETRASLYSQFRDGFDEWRQSLFK